MMKKLLIFSVILALSSVSQAVVFQDTFDHGMDDNWAQINYLEWLTNEHPAAGGWSINMWDGFICIPNPGTGIVGGIDVENYVPSKNVKYDAPYPLVPYTEEGMKEYWLARLPDGTYPAPDVYYNEEGPFGPADSVPYWTPGTAPDVEVLNGKLVMKSIAVGWEHTMNTGPFVYKMWTGDFDAYVEVVSYDGWWYNMGGLMARAPNPQQYDPDGGQFENWVSVVAEPGAWWDGNRGNNTVNGVTEWIGIKGDSIIFNFLKLTRRGNLFRFYAGERVPGEEAGGQLVWTLLGSVVRDDLPEELEVGIYQGNFIDDWSGEMHFDNFLLVPEPATIALLGLGGLALIRRKR
jgi:hypothetical protein